MYASIKIVRFIFNELNSYNIENSSIRDDLVPDHENDDVDPLEELRKELRSMREELRELKITSKAGDVGGDDGDEDSGERDDGRGISAGLILSKSDDGKKVIIDVGSMGEMMEDMVNGIKGEIQKSILIGKDRLVISRTNGRNEKLDEEEASRVFAALGNEHRIAVLRELATGGMYASELEEKVPVAASTLSAHMKTLEDAGLVVQEAVRGRYLITLSGRRALKAARNFSRRASD